MTEKEYEEMKRLVGAAVVKDYFTTEIKGIAW